MDGQGYQLYIPRSYVLTQLPKGINSRSSSHLFWKSHFEGKTFGLRAENEVQGIEILHLAKRSQWNRFLAEIRSYTQIHGSGVEVARLAVGVRMETRYEGQREARRLWLNLRRML